MASEWVSSFSHYYYYYYFYEMHLIKWHRLFTLLTFIGMLRAITLLKRFPRCTFVPIFIHSHIRKMRITIANATQMSLCAFDRSVRMISASIQKTRTSTYQPENAVCILPFFFFFISDSKDSKGIRGRMNRRIKRRMHTRFRWKKRKEKHTNALKMRAIWCLHHDKLVIITNCELR